MPKLIILTVLLTMLSPALAEESRPYSPERASCPVADLDLGEYTFIRKLHILPAFRTPVFIEVYSGPGKSKVVAFRIDDASPPRRVEIAYERDLAEWGATGTPPREIDVLKGFYAMKEEEESSDYSGTDGETYILEIKDKTGVHRVKRRNPEAFAKERDLEYFLSICREVVELAGIVPRRVEPRDDPK